MNIFRLFFSDFNEGGILMWVIFGVSAITWYIGLEKFLYFKKFSKHRLQFTSLAKNISENSTEPGISRVGSEPFDLLLSQISSCKSVPGPKAYKGYIREFLISIVPPLENGFTSMSAWISIAPLLGLLGTVIGMIQTFKVIMDFGVGNPSLTAEGISVALLTTQAGLTAAFPAMIFYNYLANQKSMLISQILKDCESIITILNKA